jgi:hypothetical protein
MKKFNAEEALKGAPVKLRNGQKAYIEKYNEGVVSVYAGYVDDENDITTTWTNEGTEYCFVESQRDIISMWQEEDEDSVVEVDTKADLEADQEENIFEKALDKNLPLRHTTQRADVPSFYCIAKTRDGDYILEREDRGTKIVARLSSVKEELDWYIVDPTRQAGSIPKAFMPNEGEEFWFVHTMKNKTVAYANYCDNDVYYNGLANAGLAFHTKEDAEQALRFLRSNIEVNHGEEQK